MRLSICIILSIIFILSKALPSDEDLQTVSDCLQEYCVKDFIDAEQSATQEQNNEQFKFDKCTTGSKPDNDNFGLSVSIKQDPKCIEQSDLTGMAECHKSCMKTHFSEGNPHILGNTCLIGCMESKSSVLYFSISILVSLVFALF